MSRKFAREAVTTGPHKGTVDLDDIAAAHRLADTGRKRGNFVVRIPHTHQPEGAPVMIEAHAPTKRYGDTTAVDTGDHAGAGVARSLTLGFGAAIFGAGNLPTALLVGAAWAMNLAVAERQIRKRPRRGTPRRRSRCHCHDRRITPGDGVPRYELRLEGHLNNHWYDWIPA